MKYYIMCYPMCDEYCDSKTKAWILRVFDGGRYTVNDDKKYKDTIKDILTNKLNLTPEYKLSPRSVVGSHKLAENGIMYDRKNGKYIRTCKNVNYRLRVYYLDDIQRDHDTFAFETLDEVYNKRDEILENKQDKKGALQFFESNGNKEFESKYTVKIGNKMRSFRFVCTSRKKHDSFEYAW